MADTKLDILIRLQDEASAKLATLNGHIKDIEGTSKKSNSSFLGLAGAIGVGNIASQAAGKAFSALTGVVKDSFGAYQQSENVIAQLRATLDSTGNTAGGTAEQIQAFSTHLEHLTGISDEAITAAQGNLLTFTSLGKEAFPQATQAAIDMAAHFAGTVPTMQDIFAQTQQLGKALQDPDAGLGALHRVGVNVEELRKQFTDTMPIQEKQRLILQELSKEYGGAAIAAGTTAAGGISKLHESVDDLQEKLGEALAKGLNPFIQKLSAWANSTEGQQAIQRLADGIARFFQYIFDHQDQIMAFFRGIGIVAKVLYDAFDLMTKPLRIFIDLLSQTIDKVEKFVSTVKGSGIAPAISGLLNIAGFRADGGPIEAGKPYVVGERGPEIVVPQSSGTVIPNGKGMGAISVNIYGNVSTAGGTSDIEALAQRLGRMLQNASYGV